MGDLGEPGNARSAAMLAESLTRPDNVECTCGVGGKGFDNHKEECARVIALRRFGKIFDHETGRVPYGSK